MSVRTEHKSRPAFSPFYAIAGLTVIALTILGFFVVTR